MKQICAIIFAFAASTLQATTYNVGASQSYKTLGAVPWNQLGAGDTVNIYYQPACYAEKFLLSTQGASWANPVTVQGVVDPLTGKRPCITGLNAVQAKSSMDRWSGTSAQYSEGLYVVGISLQANASYGPQYIVVKNLEITGAAEGGTYTADDGSKQTYGAGVAGIRIVNGNHVRIQNCYIHGITGNGVFGKPNGSFAGAMADIELLYNRIGGNGKAGNYSVHNSYVEADQALYQGNLYEPLVTGGAGSDLKDRSAGTVVAYNRFAGAAARFIDLVEPQDGWSIFGSRSYYGSDFVFGNTFFVQATDVNAGAFGTPIHYGGDQGAGQYYRNQTLSFYDNTFVFIANQNESWKHGIFQPELATDVVDVRNNIFLFLPRTAGGGIAEFDWSANNNGAPTGKFQFGVNWVSPGWHMAFTGWTAFAGTSTGTASLISPADNHSPLKGATTGDFSLPAGSGAIGVAGALSALVAHNPQGGDYTLGMQYMADQQTVVRTSLADLGAFAAGVASTTPVWTPIVVPGGTSIAPPVTPPGTPPVVPPVVPPSGTTGKKAVFQQGVNGYVSGMGTAISDLYTSYSWNGGHGVNFADNGTLLLKNTDTEIRPLLEFANLTIPGLNSVVSAQLTLTVTSWVKQGPVTGYYLNQPWATSANWSNRTATNTWAAPGASADGVDRFAGVTFTIPQLSAAGVQTITINLDPAVVNGWLHTPASNNGIILVESKVGGGVSNIASHTAATVSTRPMLTITYQ